MDEPGVVIAFLDVGQGDSTVIRLPDLEGAIVVDCPNKPTTADYLEEKDIKYVYLFITHTDLDHVGGSAMLTENCKQIETLAYNHDTLLIAGDHARRRLILRHLAQLIQRRGIRTTSPRAGESISIQGVSIDILHPEDADLKQTVARGDTNNASILLRISYEGKRVLLAADIQGAGWQWIVERGTDLQADVLKFPHHGAWYVPSATEPTLEDVVQLIDAQLVVLSLGSHNRYGHPATRVLDLLRRRANLRFICTEATSKCYSKLAAGSKGRYPCAGNIEVTLNSKGVTVTPSTQDHVKVVSTFDTPQCRVLHMAHIPMASANHLAEEIEMSETILPRIDDAN